LVGDGIDYFYIWFLSRLHIEAKFRIYARTKKYPFLDHNGTIRTIGNG
jgi:hypothetical protein